MIPYIKLVEGGETMSELATLMVLSFFWSLWAVALFQFLGGG